MFRCFRKETIACRIYYIIAMSLFGILAVYILGVQSFSKTYHNKSVQRTQELVDIMCNTAATEARRGKLRGEDIEITKKNVMEMLVKDSLGPTDYFWVASADGKMVWHPKLPGWVGKDISGVTDANGKRFYADIEILTRGPGKGFYEYEWPLKFEGKDWGTYQKKIVYARLVPELGWIINHGVYTADIDEEIWKIQSRLGLLILAVTCLSVAGAYFAARSIARPVVELNKQFARMANGDFDFVVAQQERKDEIGEMARTAQFFLDNLKQIAFINEEKAGMEEMKNEFIAVVSHELRTPLTSIRGSLGLLVGAMSDQLPGQVNQLISIAHKNSERLIVLINDILDINKIASGQMRFEMKKESLAELMKQSVETTKAYADKYFVRFDCYFPDSELSINVDPARFAQVLTNFLSNAAKFSPGGAKVDVFTSVRGGQVRISVKDYGLGIPEEFRARIFQKFSQAESSQTRSKGGSGLGLYICKQLVEHMGGSVGYNTQLGIGTEFWAEFPIVGGTKGGAEDRRSEAPTISIVPEGLPLVLNIESDNNAHQILARKLDGIATLQQSSSLVEIEYLLQSKNIRLVLVNLQMPTHLGVDLIERIPFMAGKMVPIVVLTVVEAPDWIRGFITETINKSKLSPDQVVEKIRKHLVSD